MKKVIIIIIILILFSITELNSTVIIVPNLGIGNSHGGLGLKTLIGLDNEFETGWIIGLGANGGKFAYSIGFQYSISTFYFSANYGNVGTYTETEGGDVTKKEVITGYFFEIGKVFYFNQSKIFLDTGIGYSISDKFKFGEDDDYSSNGIAWDVGIGYKF